MRLTVQMSFRNREREETNQINEPSNIHCDRRTPHRPAQGIYFCEYVIGRVTIVLGRPSGYFSLSGERLRTVCMAA